MKEKLKSRKLWMTVAGGIVTGVFFPALLPAYIKIMAPTYVSVQGAVDLVEKLVALKK